MYLMHGDEITLTRGTGALWQLGAGRANLIDRGLCGCSLARKLRPFLATSFDQFALTAGFGLHTGPLHVDFAIGRWGLGGGDGLVSALSLSFWPTF